MRRLTIVFFDAGGGHRNAAEALKTTLEEQNSWHVTLLNLQELLDTVDIVRGVTGVRTQDAYNLVLRKGWTRFSPQLLPPLQKLIRLYHGRIVKLLLNYWAQNPADMVLSVIPHFNRALAQSVRQALPEAPFVTLLTDFADYPPHFWIERESEYIICGTEFARHQALEMGHPREKVFDTSGMVLKPRFYRKLTVDRDAERERIGLAPGVPTGIVLFGGQGSSLMVDIAKRLDESPAEVQLIMLCGRGDKIRSELQALPLKKRVVTIGFTTEVDSYMALADFFIGKPGPGSISEALQFHLPVMVERNARTMPQERYNTDWLQEKRLGIVLSSFKEIASGVDRLLAPATFAELCRNASAYHNRALFEVPVILESVFERHTSETAETRTRAHDSGMLQPGSASWAALT